MNSDFPDILDNMLKSVCIEKHGVEACVNLLLNENEDSNPNSIVVWLAKAVTFIDLTTLSGDDTVTNVTRLCMKAAQPLSPEITDRLVKKKFNLTTAAVCVYPNRVEDAYNAIHRMGLLNTIQIASVATGFPSGLYPLYIRLQEIQYCLSKGANEIDVVLDRSLVLAGRWKEVYHEVEEMKKTCGSARLKVILGVGEIGTFDNIYKASMVSMFAGADFIKTSTGKEAVNATLPIGLIMCRAIKHYYNVTGRKVGLKPAGGIKTPKDAVNWLILVNCELGEEWLTPSLFRIGASSLLGSIEKYLYEYATGETVADDKFNFI